MVKQFTHWITLLHGPAMVLFKCSTKFLSPIVSNPWPRHCVGNHHWPLGSQRWRLESSLQNSNPQIPPAWISICILKQFSSFSKSWDKSLIGIISSTLSTVWRLGVYCTDAPQQGLRKPQEGETHTDFSPLKQGTSPLASSSPPQMPAVPGAPCETHLLTWSTVNKVGFLLRQSNQLAVQQNQDGCFAPHAP